LKCGKAELVRSLLDTSLSRNAKILDKLTPTRAEAKKQMAVQLPVEMFTKLVAYKRAGLSVSRSATLAIANADKLCRLVQKPKRDSCVKVLLTLTHDEEVKVREAALKHGTTLSTALRSLFALHFDELPSPI